MSFFDCPLLSCRPWLYFTSSLSWWRFPGSLVSTCPACPVLDVPFWLSCYSCPRLAVCISIYININIYIYIYIYTYTLPNLESRYRTGIYIQPEVGTSWFRKLKEALSQLQFHNVLKKCCSTTATPQSQFFLKSATWELHFHNFHIFLAVESSKFMRKKNGR